MKITHFRDLDCWKKARELVRVVYHATGKAPFKYDLGLKDQIQRSSVSVMANIAEGFGARSNTEFARFLGIATRSASEVQSHLYVALDVGYLKHEDMASMEILCVDCISLCKGLIRYLRSRGA